MKWIEIFPGVFEGIPAVTGDAIDGKGWRPDGWQVEVDRAVMGVREAVKIRYPSMPVELLELVLKVTELGAEFGADTMLISLNRNHCDEKRSGGKIDAEA